MIRNDLDSLEATCLLCLQTKPRQDLDRLLWCDACIAAAQARAASQSWVVGLAVPIQAAQVKVVDSSRLILGLEQIRGNPVRIFVPHPVAELPSGPDLDGLARARSSRLRP